MLLDRGDPAGPIGVLGIAAAEGEHGVWKSLLLGALGTHADDDGVTTLHDREAVGRGQRVDMRGDGGPLDRAGAIGWRERGGHGIQRLGGLAGGV
jgi:hypothetical protein